MIAGIGSVSQRFILIDRKNVASFFTNQRQT